jgi:GTPase SAR1 family protein
LIKNDRGKTKAALPTIIRTSSIELTATDVPGLQKAKSIMHIKYIDCSYILLEKYIRLLFLITIRFNKSRTHNCKD